MSKKISGHENYRVVIEPRRLGDFGGVRVSDRMVCPDEEHRQREYKQRCEEIMEEVKRHVDNVGSVDIECDVIEECSHCGAKWTEDSNEYNGGCCEADQDAQNISWRGLKRKPK